ncbi:MAG: hypothetical protein ACP5GI_00745 [Sulfolobales archaeon]
MYQWRPKWIRVKITLRPGEIIETCKDESTGLFICPICSDINIICPSDKKSSSVTPEKTVYFFSEEDLRNHIYAHSESSEWGKSTGRIEEEEEEEEEDEED